MELHVDDDGFVRAPAPLVYRRLTDIGSYREWWPGLQVERLERSDEAWRFRMRHGMTRLRFEGVPGAWRLDTGFVLSLTGDLEGRAEFWLERVGGGTTVHHLLVARTARRRPVRVLRTYRRVLRRGLWACKDLLQAEVLAGTEASGEAGLHP